MESQEYSLREKKHARTKIGLMNAFLERLRKKPFDDISIKEVCQAVEIAEGTFFNYFPEKIDVIDYYLQLRTLKIIWEAQTQVSGEKYIDRINYVFGHMAAEELNNENVISQILSVLLLEGKKPKNVVISDLEKKLVFPNFDGIENVKAMGIVDWLHECLVEAVKNNELPAKTNVHDIHISLMTILGGTLLAARFENLKNQDYHYVRQVRNLWKVLGVKGLDK